MWTIKWKRRQSVRRALNCIKCQSKTIDAANFNWFWLNFKVWQLVIIDWESLEGCVCVCVHNYWAAEKLLSLPWHFLQPLLGAKLTFWKRISLDPLIHFWLQVAKMLKEIPRGSTFVIRLVEPLKAGFGNFLSFLLVFRPPIIIFFLLLGFFHTSTMQCMFRID